MYNITLNEKILDIDQTIMEVQVSSGIAIATSNITKQFYFCALPNINHQLHMHLKQYQTNIKHHLILLELLVLIVNEILLIPFTLLQSWYTFLIMSASARIVVRIIEFFWIVPTCKICKERGCITSFECFGVYKI